jgi:RHS repeat-associated protein
MESIRRCLVWGEGSEGPACLGAATPAPPALPPDLRRILRRTALAATSAALAAWAAIATAIPVALVPTDARADDSSPAFGAGLEAALGSPSIDPATGIATALVPLEVPPGRHGMAPELALRYNSAAGSGNAGLGFSLLVGSIERSTRLGPPRFDDTDTFVLQIDGRAWDLFPADGSSTRFRTVIDSGFLVERVRPGPFGAASSFFVARGRDGRRYRFGFVADAFSTSQTADFKWGLDRVEDPSGNVMTIDWAAGSRELYPIRIAYAAHPATGLAATNSVELCWEERGDRPQSASGEVFTHRLHEVRTFAGTAPARVLTLNYNSPGSLTSPLGTCRTSVDAVPPGGSIPPPTPAPGPGSPPGAKRMAPDGGGGSVPPSPVPIRRVVPLPGPTPEPVPITPLTGIAPIAPDDDLTLPDTGLNPSPSLLMSLDRGDGAGGGLPSIQYTYTHADLPAWPAAGAAGLVPPAPFVYVKSDADEDSGARLVDLNRDGLPDMAQLEGRLANGVWSTSAAVWINDGASFVYDPGWSAALLRLVQTGDASRNAWFVIKRGTSDRVDNGVRFLDVNDDGYPDVVRLALYFGSGLRKSVFLNTGSGFTSDVAPSWPIPDEPFVSLEADPSRDLAEDLGIRFADVDADGRTDMVVSRAEWGASSDRRIYRHTGAGWRLDARWVLPDEPFTRHIPHGHWLDMGLRFMDLDGDGFPDLYRASNVNGVVATATYLNTGRPDGVTPTFAATSKWGFLGVQAEHFVQVSSSGDGLALDRGLRVCDVDGDGRSDIVIGRQWNGGPLETFLFTPDRSGTWTWRVLAELPWVFVSGRTGGPSRDLGVRLADLQGDGGVDMLLGPDNTARAWRPNVAWRGRPLLSSYSSGLGGRTDIVYAPAPHTGSIEGGGRAALPFPLPVVSEVRASDGLSQTLVTRIAYSGGFFHQGAREWRGFRSVTVTGPGGEASVETIRRQQPGLAAAPLAGAPAETIERRLADGAIFARTLHTYDETDGLPPLRHLPLRVETRLFEWETNDPESSAWVRRTAVSWSYLFDDGDPQRPLLQSDERREGDPGDPTDDRTLRRQFWSQLAAGTTGAASGDAWLLEMPWHATLLDAQGNVATESWTGYDAQPYGASGSAGLPTRLESRGGPPGAPGAHGPGDPDNPVTTRVYDAYGNLASETDPLGRTRRLDHGVEDRTFTFPEREIDPLGRASLRRFDPRTGLPVAVTDANGRTVATEYDGFGRRIAEWGPLDSADRPTVSYRYEEWLQPARVHRFVREVSGLGERIGTHGCLESVAYFDGLGRLLEVAMEDALGRSITGAVTFDASGRVASRAEPFSAGSGNDPVPPSLAPYATRFEYDAASRLVRTTDPAGAVSLEEPHGSTVARIDPAGHRTETTRDPFDQVITVREFEGSGGNASPRPPATYRYDAAGRLLSIVDPTGAVTALAYDLLGRRLALDDPHIGSWRYRYDLAGQSIEETDPEGRVSHLAYDALGRLVGRTLSDGRHFDWRYDEGGAPFDALGRLTSIVDPTGMQSFAYDPLGRVTRATRTLFGAAYTATTEYDAMGRMSARTWPGGYRVDFSYDAGGRLQAAAPYMPAIDTDVRGAIQRVDYRGGNRLTRDHDPATGRLVSLQGFSQGNAVLDQTYAYDADGLIASLDDRPKTGSPRFETYTYDSRHRLVAADTATSHLTYGYDDVGTIRLKDGVTFTPGNPAQPQRLVSSSAGDYFAYDPEGNVIARLSQAGSRTMTYDAAGRMTRLSEPSRGLEVTTDYDATGQMVRETTTVSGARRTLLVPFPGVEVRDGQITVQVFLGTLRVLTLGPGAAVTQPMCDLLGSARSVLTEGGAVVASAAYKPYGEPRGGEVADSASTLRFAAAHRQDESGLLLMGWRHYDPSMGRFIEPDHVLASLYDPQALNRYAYARDNPVNLTDPSGHNPILALLFIGGVFAALERDTRADVAQSVALTAASIFLTGALGPGVPAGFAALRASTPALFAAGATRVLMDTPLGQGVAESVASLLDDLGVAPRTSTRLAAAGTTWLFNQQFQRGAAGVLARNGSLTRGAAMGDRGDLDQALDDRDLDPGAFGTRSGDAYGATVEGVADPESGAKELQRYYELRDANGRVAGVYGTRPMGPAFDHGAAAIPRNAVPQVQPLVTHTHYAYLVGGISTQQFARDLYEAGYATSLFTLTGRASDFMIEFVYGPYGGGLVLGLDVASSGEETGGAR